MSMTPSERACFEELLAKAPPGPRIEIGVFKGATLRIMAKHDDVTYGVDSFDGMAVPSEKDIKDGWNPYPRGRLKAAKPNIPNTELFEGFVPHVFNKVPERDFAFAHVDVDHFGPTKWTLHYLHNRMKRGGIVVCDDWFADRDWLAAGAINEFTQIKPLAGTLGRKAWFQY